MCEKPLSALCTEKSNIKKSCKGLIKPTGCITEFLSGKKCNMQEENQNLNHFENIKNKNFSIKFDECGKTEKEKLISKNFNSLPLFYYVSDLSHNNGPGQPVMECPLRQPASGSSYYHHHYHHIPDQTKSLQELQNEVGALLEFRNLVIETFPDLKNKMASISASHTLTAGSGTNSPFVSRLEWEPGIRIKRKLVQLKDSSSSIFAEGGANDSAINSAPTHVELSSSSLTRSRSNSHSGKKEPKSGEGNGSVVIQDSGFSTETSSSKEAHSASSTTGALQGTVITNRLPLNELDDELLNLLDVIHRKSNKIRDEIEGLQNKETYKNNNETSTILSDQFVNKCSTTSTIKGCGSHKNFQEYIDKVNKDDVQLLRKERDKLLDKLAEMEAESITDKIKISKLQSEVEELTKIKKELEDHLKVALGQKIEINSRLQEFNKYHSGFTNNSPSLTDTLSRRQYTSTPLVYGPVNILSRYSPSSYLNDNESFNKSNSTATIFSPLVLESDDTFNTPLSKSVVNKKLSNTFHSDINKNSKYDTTNLGHLDGFISEPCHLTKQRAIDSRKFAAILKETNVIELQRHLLTLTVQNQVLSQKLDLVEKSKFNVNKRFEKYKEDIDDLRFQLEEKKIELEGTKAQLRVLESQSSKLDYHNQQINISIDEILHSPASTLNQEETILSNKTSNSEHIFDMEDVCRQISTPSMKAMVPIAMEDIAQHNSSSTESAQDHNENDVGVNIGINISTDVQRRERPRPPSRIPLLGNKLGLTSPKPPSGRLSTSVIHTKAITTNNTSSISNKYLCRSTGNLCGKSPTSLNRPNSAQSLRKDSSLLNTSRSSTSSIPVSSHSQSGGSGGIVGAGHFMSSSLNHGKFNPSQQNQYNKQNNNNNNSKFNSNSPIVKHKREHMSSSRARNLDSLSRNNQNNNNSNNNISTFSSSAPGRSSNSNNLNNNNSKNNIDKSFFNSSSTNFHRLNNNNINAKKDSSFNFAQTDNNMGSKSVKPKMNLTTNIRRISTTGRSTTNNPITELQQQHLQLQQKPQGQQLLLQQSNSQNNDVDNGKVRNLRSTVLGWLKF